MSLPQSELRKMSDEDLELLADQIKYVREWRKHNQRSPEEYAAEAAAYVARQVAVQTIAKVLTSERKTLVQTGALLPISGEPSVFALH